MFSSNSAKWLFSSRPAFQARDMGKTHSLDFLVMMSGFLIVGVVLLHARINYDLSAGYTKDSHFYQVNMWYAILETLRMYPVNGFVFISAFRFQYSLLRYKNYEGEDGRFLYRKYAQKRFKRLAIPYAIWTLVFLLLDYGLYSVRSPMTLAQMPVQPPTEIILRLLTHERLVGYQLWFIPMLLFVMLFVVWFRFVLKRPELSYAVFAMYLGLRFLTPQLFTDLGPLAEWLIYIINFEFGILCAHEFYERGRLLSLRVMFIVWLGITVLRFIPLPGPLPDMLYVSAMVVTPLFLYSLAANLIPQTVSKRNVLYRLGVLTFPIFIIHGPFLTSGIVQVFTQVGLYDLWILIPIALVSVSASILIYRIMEHVVPSRVLEYLF